MNESEREEQEIKDFYKNNDPESNFHEQAKMKEKLIDEIADEYGLDVSCRIGDSVNVRVHKIKGKQALLIAEDLSKQAREIYECQRLIQYSCTTNVNALAYRLSELVNEFNLDILLALKTGLLQCKNGIFEFNLEILTKRYIKNPRVSAKCSWI